MLKTKNRNSSITNLIYFIIIVIIINLISLNVFFRLDFSDGKIYSLSQASKNTIAQITGRMIIKAYFSDDLPPQLADVRRYTKDILTEYKIASDGNIQFEFVSNSDEAKFKQEAQQNGIPPVNVNVQENDRMEVREAYLGLAFFYLDKKSEIPLVQKTRGLEYEITKTIKQISILNLPQVALYNPNPMPEMDPRMQMFGMPKSEYEDIKNKLSEGYDVHEVTLEEPFDDYSETDVIIIPGIRDSLNQKQLYTLDQLIMKGKKTIFLQDKVNADLQQQRATPNTANVLDLLGHYGVKINNNLVIDNNCGQINIQEQKGLFRVNTPMNYPLFPVINNMNRDNPIVQNLEDIQMIFASEIDTTNLRANIDFTPLLYSSKESGLLQGRLNIGIQQFKNNQYLSKLTNGNRLLAGIYRSNFDSYFVDNNNPNKDSGFRAQSPATDILLVSDGDFIKSSAAGRVPGNQDFIINAVDYLSNNADLISLRSRAVAHRPLSVKKIISTEGLNSEQIESKLAKSRRTVKWLNILAPVILMLLFGLWNYQKEKNLRKRLKEIYE